MSRPPVSVVIPCLNEAARLATLLDSLAAQDNSDFEIILVDGGSRDGTLSVAQRWHAEHPAVRLRLLPNPHRHIPHALNLGIAAAQGEVIVRLDAHARPACDYVRQCMAVLAESGAAVVGGAWTVRPGAAGGMALAIALAVSSPLGAGDARYRLSGKACAGEVDTVPFGCFRRATWVSVNGYNEALLTNEDYEFNLRVRRQSGRVFFDPRIRCDYFARPGLLALVGQYWRYGWWKAQTLKRYPHSLRLRQSLPLVWSFVGMALLPLALAGPAAAVVALAAWGSYLGAVSIGAAQQAWRERDAGLWAGVAAAYVGIHFAWGLGAWTGLVARRGRLT
jgi:succinoglycan biosynthesis protein ExoA